MYKFRYTFNKLWNFLVCAPSENKLLKLSSVYLSISMCSKRAFLLVFKSTQFDFSASSLWYIQLNICACHVLILNFKQNAWLLFMLLFYFLFILPQNSKPEWAFWTEYPTNVIDIHESWEWGTSFHWLFSSSIFALTYENMSKSGG